MECSPFAHLVPIILETEKKINQGEGGEIEEELMFKLPLERGRSLYKLLKKQDKDMNRWRRKYLFGFPHTTKSFSLPVK